MERHTKLMTYIHSHEKTLFVWGSNDCCTFASDWVAEATGVNPLYELGFYGKYETEDAANRLVKKLGGLIKILKGSLGDPIHVAYARPGDIVCGDLADYGETLGICIGVDCVFLGVRDLVIKRTVEMKKAWRI